MRTVIVVVRKRRSTRRSRSSCHTKAKYWATREAESGIASAAFVAFLSSLTNISFTAMQYAIFSSLMTLLPKLLGGYSGSMVDALGYPGFFLLTAVMGIPVLVLILIAARRLQIDEHKPKLV